MTISPDTIRTVIEIVPRWGFNSFDDNLVKFPEQTPGHVCRLDKMQQYVLDALAAAAVRVVKSKGLAVSVEPWAIKIGEPQHKIHVLFHASVYEGTGDDTERTLEAIAEFVNKGGFESE